jgi:hypothetical protein
MQLKAAPPCGLWHRAQLWRVGRMMSEARSLLAAAWHSEHVMEA